MRETNTAPSLMRPADGLYVWREADRKGRGAWWNAAYVVRASPLCRGQADGQIGRTSLEAASKTLEHAAAGCFCRGCMSWQMDRK